MVFLQNWCEAYSLALPLPPLVPRSEGGRGWGRMKRGVKRRRKRKSRRSSRRLFLGTNWQITSPSRKSERKRGGKKQGLFFFGTHTHVTSGKLHMVLGENGSALLGLRLGIGCQDACLATQRKREDHLDQETDGGREKKVFVCCCPEWMDVSEREGFYLLWAVAHSAYSASFLSCLGISCIPTYTFSVVTALLPFFGGTGFDKCPRITSRMHKINNLIALINLNFGGNIGMRFVESQPHIRPRSPFLMRARLLLLLLLPPLPPIAAVSQMRIWFMFPLSLLCSLPGERTHASCPSSSSSLLSSAAWWIVGGRFLDRVRIQRGIGKGKEIFLALRWERLGLGFTSGKAIKTSQ